MKDLLARLRAAWANLADRERLLVSLAGGALGIALIWLLGVMPAMGHRENVAARVSAAEQELQVMARLRAEYDEVSQRLATVEQQIRNGNRGNLRTVVENLAQQTGVKIESMEPQPSPQNETYRETKVEVGLKAVTLAQTVNYLHRIEGEGLSVKSLRIRTRSDKPELLDVTFTVSSFEPR
jgi:type II secretory pathway component PulM